MAQDPQGSRSRGEPTKEMVQFWDAESNRVVRISASELRPGVVQVQIQGMEGLVWAFPNQFQAGELRHPPFDEEVAAFIRQIQETFTEHRPLSYKEWEDGFRRDSNPEQEIAYWYHAANVYSDFADQEHSAPRRAEIYKTIVTCMVASPETVWHVLKPDVLTHAETEQIVNRFYSN